MAEDYHYVGGELELFANAIRWKNYYRGQLAPYIHGDVLEVGAGIGGTTRILCSSQADSWTSLEPDRRLLEQLRANYASDALPVNFEIVQGTLDSLPSERQFDTILYIDVLEHIENDRGELEQATRYLKPGGHLIVLAPAHQKLFSPFDESVGHYRRYSRTSLMALTPADTDVVRVFYLDSVGLLASLANRTLLRASMPSERQIRLWDRCFVPLSRLADPVFAYRLGKSVIAIWQAPANVPVPADRMSLAH
jgi:SAM-dependent methyltransferase